MTSIVWIRSAERPDRPDLAEADARDRDHDHVEGVERAPSPARRSRATPRTMTTSPASDPARMRRTDARARSRGRVVGCPSAARSGPSAARRGVAVAADRSASRDRAEGRARVERLARRRVMRSAPAAEPLVERHGQDDDGAEHQALDLRAVDPRRRRWPVPLMTIWIRNRPSTVPRIEPTPPERLQPPTTAAVIAIQLVGDAEPGVGLAAPAGEEDAAERREHAREAVGDRLEPPRRQAAQPRGGLVAAEREEVPAEHGRPHHHADRGRDHGREDGQRPPRVAAEDAERTRTGR